MAESSANSATKERQSTRKTVKLTLAEALEILTQSFSLVEDAGGNLDVEQDGDTVTVKIMGTHFVAGRLIPVSNHSADTGAA